MHTDELILYCFFYIHFYVDCKNEKFHPAYLNFI
jgi:hypothetical protein